MTETQHMDFYPIFNGYVNFCRNFVGLDPYSYQLDVTKAIIKSVILNEGKIINIEFSRQSGKTRCVTSTLAYLCFILPSLKQAYNLPYRGEFVSAIFAPQQEQARTDFSLLKRILGKLTSLLPDLKMTEANGTTISLSNGSSVHCFSASPTSHTESKTLDCIILEESQDLLDEKLLNTIYPMGAATAATRVHIGTAGYKKCIFWNNIETLNGDIFVNDANKVMSVKRKRYNETNDIMHLNYEKFVMDEIKKRGLNDDSIKTQYMLQWVLERGQFITYQQLLPRMGEYERVPAYNGVCYGGLDFGKAHDSTVLSVIDEDHRILNWLEILGDDYDTQFDTIKQFLRSYPRMRVLACDSTGNQDMMVDRLKKHVLPVVVKGYPLSAQRNDEMYKLLSSIWVGEKANGSFPKTECVEREKFVTQMLNLQKDIRGGRWVCAAPDGKDYHDDYIDSLALCELGAHNFAQQTPKTKQYIRSLTVRGIGGVRM